MKAEIRAMIQAAKAQAEHRDHAAAVVSVPSVAPPALVDELLRQEKWYTFSQLAAKYQLSWDKLARDFKKIDGVLKFGSDYRVSEAAFRIWLANAHVKAKEAA